MSGQLTDAEDFGKEIDRLRRENDFLRAHCGTSAKSCVYCGLGSEEQGKCVLGFPGCSRADDQQLCREVFTAQERDEYRKALEEIAEIARTGCNAVDELADDHKEMLRVLVFKMGEVLGVADRVLDK
jgi:hypothetical protein